MYKISKISIITFARLLLTTDLPLPCFCITHAPFHVFQHFIGQYNFYLPFNTKKTSRFPWLVERVDLSSCNWEMNASGMTRQSDSSIVFRWKKPVKTACALHRDSVRLSVKLSMWISFRAHTFILRMRDSQKQRSLSKQRLALIDQLYFFLAKLSCKVNLFSTFIDNQNWARVQYNFLF